MAAKFTSIPQLNTHLETRSYLDGYTPSRMDLSVFDSVDLPAASFPHALRWYKHIASFSDSKKASLSGTYEKLVAGKTPAAQAAPAAQEQKGGKKDKKDKGGKQAAPADKDKEKKLKKVIKEGGKKGVEIEGASVMAGLEFFTTQLDEPDGDMEMLVEGMKAMNAEPDPNNDEERKGGSGCVGKIVFSAGSTELLMVCNVPDISKSKIDAKEWLTAVAASVGGKLTGTRIPAKDTGAPSAGDLLTASAKGDADKGQFPIKMKDTALTASIAFLRSKGCFPDDDDDDDEMVFGDDANFDDYE